MKKKSIILIISVLTVFVFSACSNVTALGENFDELEVIAKAEEAIELFHGGECDLLCEDYFDDTIKESLTVEKMEQAATSTVDAAGEFVEYTKTATFGSTLEDGSECAIAVIVAKYENASYTYTITLDGELEITGFYIK